MTGRDVVPAVDPTLSPAWAPWIAQLRTRAIATAHDPAEAARGVVAAVLGQLAASGGWDPEDHDLRLLDGSPGPELPPVPAGLAGPDLLGAVHEALLDPEARRSSGAHYTPPPLAAALLDWGLEGWAPDGPGPARTVDLSVGGGAFLLAAARWSTRRGGAPGEVLAALSGIDVDPVAVAVAEAALVCWARAAGWDGDGPGPMLRAGDGRIASPQGPGSPTPGTVDLVVGNPPFRGQLAARTVRDRATAARLRAAVGPEVAGYADDAAVFLRVGCRWPRPGGRVVLIQPESTLAARGAAGIRAAVGEQADLVGLWSAGERVFGAAVEVCAPVLEVRRPGARPAPPVARAHGATVTPAPEGAAPAGGAWAPLLAAARGVPTVALDDGAGEVGDLATATAGFRQHFYALVPHLRELDGDAPQALPGSPVDVVPVATTALVDPASLDWGRRPARIGGRTWRRPAVSVVAVAADDAEVARWIRARVRPKVLVASQTRVVEAAVDADGRFVPGVPLVAVEPREADDDLAPWLLLAALSAPPVTAWAMAQAAGTGRRRDAMRLSARQVRSIPLPVDRLAWEAAARDLRAGRTLVGLGARLTGAYGLDPDHPVTDWWAARLPAGPPRRR